MKMVLILLKLIIVSVLVSHCILVPLTEAAHAVDFAYCDEDVDYAVKVTKVEIDPYPIVLGTNRTFNIYAHSGESISGGELTFIEWHFRTIIGIQTRNLCEQISCPVPIGDFVISYTTDLSRAFTTPQVSGYKFRMMLGDEAALNELTCISFPFSILPGASVANS